MPKNTLKEISKHLEKIGGVFVFRGLPGGSFTDFVQEIAVLRSLDINANIQIDPDLFEDYGVEVVPTFVYLPPKKSEAIGRAEALSRAFEDTPYPEYKKIVGNVSVPWALKRDGSGALKKLLLSFFLLPLLAHAEFLNPVTDICLEFARCLYIQRELMSLHLQKTTSATRKNFAILGEGLSGFLSRTSSRKRSLKFPPSPFNLSLLGENLCRDQPQRKEDTATPITLTIGPIQQCSF